MTVRSAWLLNASTATPAQNRQDTRLSPLGTMTPHPTDPLMSRSGLIPGPSPCNLTMSGMVATISTGRGVVQGVSAQGAYPEVVTASDSVTLANGHATLDRIDTLWLIALDSLFDTSGNAGLARIEYTQGAPSASPVAPSAPAAGTAYLRLWDIKVTANASAGNVPAWVASGLLTDQRTYTVAVGGINPGGSSVSGSYAGQWRDGGGSTGILERYSGSAWEAAVRLGNAGKVEMGDVNLYRGAANQLKSDDDLLLVGAMAGASNMSMGAWTTYVPTWTASTTNPTLGNGTLTSRWCRIGRQITWIGSLVAGSTTTGGSGFWNMTLPTPSAANGVTTVGSAEYVNNGDNEYIGLVRLPSGATSVGFAVKTQATYFFADVSNTIPVATSANTRLHWSITYEAAS